MVDANKGSMIDDLRDAYGRGVAFTPRTHPTESLLTSLSAAKTVCALGLTLFAGSAMAGDVQGKPPQAAPSQSLPSKPAPNAHQIIFAGGNLTINVVDTTLSDVLTKVAALTGLKLDVPPGATSEHLTIVELGPGPAREILSSLLSDSSFDYVIQNSSTNPDRVESVLVMVREKKGGVTPGPELAARVARSPNARTAAPAAESVEPPVPIATVAPVPENVPPDSNASNTQPPTEPDAPTAPQQLVQPNQSNFSRPGAMAPPADLSPQSMGQQLQQMYQQRMQMVQQDRLNGQQSTPTRPGNH